MDKNKPAQNGYDFHGSISRPVLENYLSRSITMNGLLMGTGCTEDHLRMIHNLGAKFLGRAFKLYVAEKTIADEVGAAALAVEGFAPYLF